MFRTATTSRSGRPRVSFDDLPDDLDPDPVPVVPAHAVLGLVERRPAGQAVGPGRVAGGPVVGMDRGLPGRQTGRGRPRRVADDLVPQVGAVDLARLALHHGGEQVR